MTDVLDAVTFEGSADTGSEGPPGLPPPSAPHGPLQLPRRYRPHDFSRGDAVLLVSALASSLAVVWLLFDQLTLLSGPFGFVVLWAVVFLALYWVVNVQAHDRQMATDRVTSAVMVLGALVMLTPLALITVYMFAKGWHYLSWHALTHDDAGVEETCVKGFKCIQPGVAHAIVGTVEQSGLAALIGVPAGILTAVFITEVGGRFTRAVRVVVTSMSGVPAIVCGIFVYAVWVSAQHGLGLGFSGFAGSLALAIMLLPMVTRGTEEVLKVVHQDLREASAALGAHEWRTVWSVVMPTARSGVISASLLGIARVVGEAAPLIVTIFGSNYLNANPFTKQSALPLVVYDQIKLPLKSAVALGFTAALVLYILVFILFILARVLGSVRFKGSIRHLRSIVADRRGTGRSGQLTEGEIA
jgi:phosphate transport system permease protein